MSSLERKALPRYYGNGSGRDSFVIFKSHIDGPVIRNPNIPQEFQRLLPFSYNTSHRYQSSCASKQSGPIDYWGDGSGRDSYILHNSGGMK